MDIAEGLRNFLQGRERSLWLKLDAQRSSIRVYVRKASRVLNGTDLALKRTLDIANVEAFVPRVGAFSELIEQAERIAHDAGLDAVFVESIFEPGLYRYLVQQRQYHVHCEGFDDDHNASSVYRLV